MIQKSYEKNIYGNLYLVPTPIGNLEDITLRAINTLKMVDMVYAEDTRETINLLKHYDINKKIESCHKYTEMKHKDKIIRLLKEGKNIAYVTDRGTPLISDPGNVIVDECIKNNINVISLPGPNALLPALNMSGISNERFLFFGFLDSKKSQKKKQLQELKNLKYTIIFYESPFRIKETIELINDIMGERKISISREISKKYEEIYRGTPKSVLQELPDPKGEFVIVVEGNNSEENYDDIDVISHVKMLIEDGISEKEAIKTVAKLHKLSKNDVYMMVKGVRI